MKIAEYCLMGLNTLKISICNNKPLANAPPAIKQIILFNQRIGSTNLPRVLSYPRHGIASFELINKLPSR